MLLRHLHLPPSHKNAYWLMCLAILLKLALLNSHEGSPHASTQCHIRPPSTMAHGVGRSRRAAMVSCSLGVEVARGPTAY